MKWYYTFDENTGAYIKAVLDTVKPQYATDKDPIGIISPVFNSGTGEWVETEKIILPGPSAEMQAINALGLIVAQMQAKETTPNA